MVVIFNEKSIEYDTTWKIWRSTHLQNLIEDIKERVREQDWYNSKDSMMSKNPAFDARKMKTKHRKTLQKLFYFMKKLNVI